MTVSGWLPLNRTMLGFGVFAMLLPGGSEAWAQAPGVRHRIDAAITIEPSSPVIQSSGGAKGSLSFSLRISANSLESRYFGTLAPVFSDIALPGMRGLLVAQTKIWEEDKCHQRRGMPKATVVLLKGSFGEGDKQQNILSVVRHIGLKVPADELTPGIKLPEGIDEIGAFYALRARSRDSHMNVDLKIYAFDCRLTDGK